MKAVRAKDVMSSPVCTVQQTASVESAAALLTAKKVTALPVLDSTGRMAGMVSESDLLWHRVPVDPTAHLRRMPDGVVRVADVFVDPTEEAVVNVLARTVPGVAGVDFGS